MTEIITENEGQTYEAAKCLAERLSAGTFIALYGDLGAGKTAFTRGLAAGLGISGRILSPTFTLLKIYTDGRLPLYHFDVYRIASSDDLIDLGFYDLAQGDGICVTEWADLIKGELPEDRLDIFFEYSDEGEARRIKIIPEGNFKGTEF